MILSYVNRATTYEPASPYLVSTADRELSRRAALGMKLVISASLLGGLAYVALRYRPATEVDSGQYLWFVLPIALYVSLAFLVYRLLRRARVGAERRWKSRIEAVWLSVTVVAVAALLLSAGSSHLWNDLVALERVGDDRNVYNVWQNDGTSAKVYDAPLTVMHRLGDETAHLAGAMAVRQEGLSPSRLQGLMTSSDAATPYWLRRHFQGHPPGLAIVYAPVASNPPAARVFSLVIFSLCVLAAGWAGYHISGSRDVGILAAVCFVAVPDILWWHAFSVSSDVPPALPVFLGIGLLGRTIQKREQMSQQAFNVSILGVGVLFALGCLITYTAFLPVAAACLLLLQWNRTRRLSILLIVALPAVLVVGLTMLYSEAVLGAQSSVFVSRARDVTGAESSYDSQGLTVLGFFFRLPQDLGLPMLLLFGGTFLVSWIDLASKALTRRLFEIAAGLAVIIPSVFFFWPQIRFMYPGWIFVIGACGITYIWPKLGSRWRALGIASIVAFALSKFILLRLTVG
jgi:hypothetical protein